VSAESIARALGEARREGLDWRCPCPVHGGRSLALKDTLDGRLLIHCFGGCEWREVFDELRASGLLGEHPGAFRPEEDYERRQREELAAKTEIERIRRAITSARDLCRRSLPAAGTLVETYLRSRGITGPIPPALRFLEYCPHRNGRYYPAMVAPIVNVAGAQIAIHKTFLRPDGSGKADLPKTEQRETRGPMKGSAVRLAPIAETLMVGEGIETCLSAMQATMMPAWAALSTSGLMALILPPVVRELIILVDNDVNGAGERAARSAAERWLAEGRRVRLAIPPVPGTDFNDVITGRGYARITEVCNAV
jgi:putative DNA primase/helicase